jgi:hypothetical protein
MAHSQTASAPNTAGCVLKSHRLLAGGSPVLVRVRSGLLGESLGFLQLIGAVLILGGAAFGELFHRKQLLEVTKDSLVS